jgi:uncharacterized membrane protein
MRTRWRILFGCALVALIGFAWLAQRFGSSWSSWLNGQLAGLIVTCVIGFLGAATQTRKRWPAAVALVCAAPMAWAVLVPGISLNDLLEYLGAPGALMIGGSAATIAVALYVLVATPPPIPVERIPSARTT